MDTLADFKTLPREAKERVYRNEESIRELLGSDEGQIRDGIWRSTRSSPGIYRAMLGQIAIVRSSDGKGFTIPFYITKEFTITESDLEAGRYRIAINEPLFQVTVVDQNGRRIAEELEISFEVQATDGHTEMTFELSTNGEITFLGDPSKYRPQVLDKPGLHIRSEPLR
jgi:hypothetical protein